MSHELYTYWPQVVLFVSAFYVRADQLRLIRSRGHKIVMLHTESPYQDDEQLMRAQFAHLNLLNDPQNVSEYSQLAPSMYMPHAYDPEVHFPAHRLKLWPESDFTFVGTMFRSRQLFFEKLIEKLAQDNVKCNVQLGGSGWDQEHLDGSPLLSFLSHPRDQSVDNTETARAYRASRAGINVYRKESEEGHEGEGWAMGPREVEMAACGLPFLRDPRPEGDEVFKGILPVFKDADEAADQLAWLLKHETARIAMGLRAQAATEDRTFKNNAQAMMQKLESLCRLT
jgi:glycosyltransferase involved in cell wall biosynthesis